MANFRKKKMFERWNFKIEGVITMVFKNIQMQFMVEILKSRNVAKSGKFEQYELNGVQSKNWRGKFLKCK